MRGIQRHRTTDVLAGGAALIRRFKTMIEAVANQMRERIADLLDHALVEFGALADQLQAHLLAKLAGEIVDHARERSEERRVGKECVRSCKSRWLPLD